MAKSLSDFKQVSLLGEGAYSAVYKVVRLTDKEVYALKKVKLPSLSDKEKQNALNEVRLLASIQHKYIVAYKEAFFDDKTRCLCIVQEFADGGDLFQQIVKCQKERIHMREADVWRYLHGMCQGLKALHDMRILHRDLKCANVFLHSAPEGMIAKLGDFNVSKVAKRGLCMTQTGTPYYASPEVWRDMPYDAKSDIWSLGCVLYEMVALRPPFRAEDMEGLYKKVCKGQYPRIPPQYSQDLSEVIAGLLQVNPRHRPAVDQLLASPVLQRNISDSALDDNMSNLSQDPNSLLQTIKLPKNVIDLSVCLPKARYDLPKTISEESPVGVGTPKLGGHTFGRQIHGDSQGLPPRSGLSASSPEPHLADSGRNPQSTHAKSIPEPLPDSLDSYVQQRAPQKQSQGARGDYTPSEQTGGAQAMLRHAGGGPLQGNSGGGQPQVPNYGAVGLPRLPPGSRASPAPSNAGDRQVRGLQAPQRQQQQARGGRMANLARHQYAMPSGQAPAQAPQQGARDGGGLRLPRLFSKAS